MTSTSHLNLTLLRLRLVLELRSSTSVHLQLRDVPSGDAPAALHPDSAPAGQLLPPSSLPGLRSQVSPRRHRSSIGQLKGNSHGLALHGPLKQRCR